MNEAENKTRPEERQFCREKKKLSYSENHLHAFSLYKQAKNWSTHDIVNVTRKVNFD